MLLGTLVDVYQQFTVKTPELTVYGGDQHEENFAFTFLKCFSININGKKILNTDPDKNDNLGCLNGIRVLSMLWIILGHTYTIAAAIYLRNPQKIWTVSQILLIAFSEIITLFPIAVPGQIWLGLRDHSERCLFRR